MSAETSAPTPPVIRRAVVLWSTFAVLFALAGAAWLIFGKFFGLSRRGLWSFVPVGLGLTPILVLLPFWHWRVRRLRQALFQSRFRLCTNCAYDLSSHPATGSCPECGKPYDAARDVLIWAAQGAPYTEPRPAGFSAWSPGELDSSSLADHRDDDKA
ncbi:MAG: hypothetical protein SFZ23_14740 [Planctomycetota bacterium]|nr:hypothetical protein [Planctomycetota bacterium]